jgi:hypothetical protein
VSATDPGPASSKATVSKPVKTPPRWLRTLFGALCFVALGVAAYLGLTTVDTDDPEPGWALGSPAVHRVGVVVALFLAFYLVLVVLFYAVQGRPFTKFSGPGGTGVEEPERYEEETETLDDLAGVDKNLTDAVDDHENRLREIEGLPPLPPRREDG